MTTFQDTVWPDTTAAAPANRDEGIPLGGWLILHAIALFVAPIRLTLLIMGAWDTLNHSSSSLLIADRDYLTTAIGIALVYLLIELVAAVMFFCRRRGTPWAMVVMYMADLLLGFVCICGLRVVLPWYDPTVSLVYSLLGALIWIPYFLSSQRVAQTFVR